METITVNGIEYVKKDEATLPAEQIKDMEYCIVRTYSAGVFAGYVKSRKGKEVELVQARRLWFWKGAASLSQLAVDGVSCPDECKFPCEVPRITLTEAIEITPASRKSQKSIFSVPVWKK